MQTVKTGAQQNILCFFREVAKHTVKTRCRTDIHPAPRFMVFRPQTERDGLQEREGREGGLQLVRGDVIPVVH